MQTLKRTRPMQIVLNLSSDIETMLQGFDKESFILQAIINELQRKKLDKKYIFKNPLSTEQENKKAWLIQQFKESRIQIELGETIRATPKMFDDIKKQGRVSLLKDY
jgi:hypothetical protein